MMEAVHTSEMFISFNMTTQRYIPEDSKFCTHFRKNLKSVILFGLSQCIIPAQFAPHMLTAKMFAEHPVSGSVWNL
jgi:nitrate/TMAO reductase-like tetraheme cytochrome c subunit